MTEAAEGWGVSFHVPGPPIPQGSLRTFHRWQSDGRCLVSVVNASGGVLKEWRAVAATAAKNAMSGLWPFDGPVRVSITFRFRAPAAHRGEHWVAVNGRNDIEKLVRALHDAMTDAAVWLDDGLVSELYAQKVYAGPEEAQGATVLVVPLYPYRRGPKTGARAASVPARALFDQEGT